MTAGNPDPGRVLDTTTSHPLVCTNGQPSAASRRLLAGLAASGCRLHIRADDDPAGQQIVALLNAMLPDASLWRYPSRAAGAERKPRYEEQDLDLLLSDLDRCTSDGREPAS